MAEIVPLEGHEKRLKSLDEFEPPTWAETGAAPQRFRTRFTTLLGLAIVLGLVGGFLVGDAIQTSDLGWWLRPKPCA